MSKVRAKFKCAGVEKVVGWNGSAPFHYTAKFQVVSNGSEENQQFFAATPGGQLSLTTLKDDFFDVGKEYYVDITPAE
jgi:hypothetical protein